MISKTTQAAFKFAQSSKFPLCEDLTSEFKKTGLLRIGLGLTALIRTLLIAIASLYYYQSNQILSLYTLSAFISCLLITLFTVGFFTPIMCIFIICYYPIMDEFLGTSTLGTNIFITVMMFYFFLNTHTYSIDHILMKKDSSIGKIISNIYAFIGSPSSEQLQLYYFILFTSYALISLGAIQYHVMDSYWMSGKTVGIMMTNSYLNKFYLSFRYLEKEFPYFYNIFSWLGVFFQSVFQILMLPLMWLNVGRLFVVLWGSLFIVISTVFLQLSYLPFVEIVLWTLIFFRPTKSVFRKRAPILKMIYDDHCSLCSNTITFLRWINIGHMFEFKPLSQSDEDLKMHHIDRQEASSHMHGVMNHQVFRGFDLYLLISRLNPLLCPFYPVLYILKKTKIGYKLYDFIAKNRYRFFGYCSLPQKSQEVFDKKQSFLFSSGVVASSLFVFTLFIFKFPFVQLYSQFGSHKVVDNILFFSGLVIPNVFNSTDLRMGDAYPVIKRVYSDGSTSLVPLNGPDGKRLYYHLSDQIYFGNSLRWRRLGIHQKLELATQPGHLLHDFILKMALFDYHLQKSKQDIVSYQVDIFKNASSNVNEKDLQKKYESEWMFAYSIQTANLRSNI